MEIIEESNKSSWKKVFPSFKVHSVWHGGKQGSRVHKNKIYNKLRLITIDSKAYLEVKTQKQEITFLCDIKNYKQLRQYTWYSYKKNNTNTYYIHTGIKKDNKKIILSFHNFVKLEWKMIDHINREGCDNREINLRDGSNGVNNKNFKLFKNNTSGKTGVSYCNDRKFWIVSWIENKKQKSKWFKGEKEDEKVKQQAIEFRKKIDKKFNIRNGYNPY